jgi:inner membrane protein
MDTIIQTAWSKGKLLVKGGLIAFIALLLMIPKIFVEELISEREQRQKEATAEVSSKWAGPQTISSPVLVLPFYQASSDSQSKKVKQFAYFLPDDLKIKATMDPTEKHRGIYKVMLYSSNVNITGSFQQVNYDLLNILPEQILWNEAFVRMNISDPRGLNDELSLNWNNRKLVLSNQVGDSGDDIMTAAVPMTGPDDLKNISFSSATRINGSEQLSFAPLGKVTTVELDSKWPHPSFTGNTLPQSSIIRDSGFTHSYMEVTES